MAKQISISVVGNSTIVKEVVNGKTNIYASNTSRNYLPIAGGIKILPSEQEAMLNNYVILIADLVNDGIDFTGVATSDDLITKLAETKAFKQGGWLGAVEVKELYEGLPDTNPFTDQDKADVAANKLTVTPIAADTAAVKGKLYILTASLILTLPVTPTIGDIIGISNRSNTTTCVVARNGKNIAALAEDLTIDALNIGFKLVYTGVTQGWILQ